MNDDAQGRQLHLAALDFFTEVFWCAADHQATDKDRQDDIHDHIHEADALTAEYHIEHHM